MATLAKTPAPGFERRPDETFDTHLERCDKELDVLRARSDALAAGEVTGALLQFQVADSYAYYVVCKDKPLTLQHVDFLDGYTVAPAHIRGLRREDVLAQLENARRWRRLAGKQSA